MANSATSSAVSYELTIGGKSFKQPQNDGLQHLCVEDHVDMVCMLPARIGGAEEQPDWGFQVGDTVECKLGSGSKKIFEVI